MPIGHVKIGPVRVPIRYERLTGCDGHFKTDPSPVITIDSRLRGRRRNMAILHEAIHAVFELYGMSDPDPEELITRVLEMSTTSLIIDNPELVAALSKDHA